MPILVIILNLLHYVTIFNKMGSQNDNCTWTKELQKDTVNSLTMICNFAIYKFSTEEDGYLIYPFNFLNDSVEQLFGAMRIGAASFKILNVEVAKSVFAKLQKIKMSMVANNNTMKNKFELINLDFETPKPTSVAVFDYSFKIQTNLKLNEDSIKTIRNNFQKLSL